MPEAEEPATRALRIDGFVRPFTERQVWACGKGAGSSFWGKGPCGGWHGCPSWIWLLLQCHVSTAILPHLLTRPLEVCFCVLLPSIQVRELLSETGQVLALWMPSIKTHAYCVFETKAQAEATRRVRAAASWHTCSCAGTGLCSCDIMVKRQRWRAALLLAWNELPPLGPPRPMLSCSATPRFDPQATYKLQWPATNPKRLAPRFVPLTEAETGATEQGQCAEGCWCSSARTSTRFWWLGSWQPHTP